MNDANFLQQTANDGMESWPSKGASLTAAVEPFEQQPGRTIEVRGYPARVAAHPVVLEMTAQMADDVLDHRRTTVHAQRAQTPIQAV